MCSVSTPARNFVKSRLAVRMPFIAPCSLQIHPSRSCPIGGRPNVSQDESAYMKAHTRSPVSTRRPSHTACSKSPYTDNGDGVGANTSSLTVVAKSFSTHLDLTSLPFIRRAQPVSRIRLVGRNVCLFDPGVRQEKRTDYHVQTSRKEGAKGEMYLIIGMFPSVVRRARSGREEPSASPSCFFLLPGLRLSKRCSSTRCSSPPRRRSSPSRETVLDLGRRASSMWHRRRKHLTYLLQVYAQETTLGDENCDYCRL